MKMRICVCIVVWMGLLAAIGSGWPQPSAVTEEGQWTLNVKYEHPVQINVKMRGWDRPRRFWYMIISLTNETSEEEVPFYPKLELVRRLQWNDLQNVPNFNSHLYNSG